MRKQVLSMIVLVFVAGFSASHARGQTVVAGEDFDGGDINLISGFDPGNQNIDGSSQMMDFLMYGVFSVDEFTGMDEAPFSLCDDSVFAVSSGGADKPFPGDSEGTIGMSRADGDHFFVVASASSFLLPEESDRTATWIFDVSSATSPLQLKIDMGQQSNDAFDGVPDTNTIQIEYRFDGAGAFQTAFSLLPVELVGSGFTYRLFDSGKESIIDFGAKTGTPGTHLGLAAANAGVTRTLIDTEATAPNTILDRSPAIGPGAGLLDTFSVDLDGSGSSLEIVMTVDFGFESFAMDNILICTESKDCKLGDVNLDGMVTLLDVDPFVALLTTGDFQCEADIDQNGIVNLLDVDPFVMLLSGG